MVTILLVEDEKLLLDVLERTLINYFPDCKVVKAANGYEGIEALKTQQVSVVITGLMMPRLDGFKLASYAQQYHPEIPVLVVSGLLLDRLGDPFNVEDIKSRLSQLNVKGWLSKPFIAKDFRDLLHTYIS